MLCKTTHFCPIFAEKRGENPVFTGSLLFAIQIYNIFRRNPNRFNISQQSSKCLKTSFAQASLWDVLYYEALQRIHYSKRFVCSFAFTEMVSTTSP